MPQPKKTFFEELDAESKRVVTYLTPLLRLADSLDRSHEQKVKDLSLKIKDPNLQLLVSAADEPSLELWAASEALRAFKEVYGRGMTIQRTQAQSA